MLLKKITTKIILAIALIACVVSFAACSGDDIDATEITSVKIDKGGEKVQLQAAFLDDILEEYDGGKVYLLAGDLPKSGTLTDGFEVIGEAKLKAKVKFSFSLTDDMMRSRLAKAFVVAIKSGDGYLTVTPAAYIENPEAIADGSADVNGTASIKGLSTDAIIGAEIVGAEHIMLEADMDKLLLHGYKEGAVKFISDGVTYYFDGEAVAALDNAVNEANLLGMRVYMRTSLRYPALKEDETFEREPIDVLYCKGAALGSKGYMPNFANSTAVGYVKAFYNFLGARYSDSPDKVLDYVIGEKVNDYSNYCDMALRGEEEVLNYYSVWLRMANNILLSHNKNASVYVSVSNDWRVEEGSRILGSKYFLSQLAQISRQAGDFGWKVAMSLDNPDDIPTVIAGEEVDYSRINADSLFELFDFIKGSNMVYGSLPRDVIIDSISIPQSVSEPNRAAYYTYTYYNAAEMGVKAMIYSEKNECFLGGKDLYYSVLLCGSNAYSQLEDYIDLIQYASVPDMSAYAARALVYEQSIASTLDESIRKNSKAMEIAFDEFVTIGNAYDNSIFYKNNADGTAYRAMKALIPAQDGVGGVACFNVPAEKLISSGYLGMRLSAKVGEKITIVISGKGNGEYSSYVGEATAVEESGEYFLNITKLTDSIESGDTLSIMVIAEGDGLNEKSFDIDAITLYGSSGNGASSWIVIIGVVVGVLGVCGLLFWLTSRRRRKISAHNDD